MRTIKTQSLLAAFKQHNVDESSRLRLLDRLLGTSLLDLHDRVQHRISLNRQVTDLSENGLVAVVVGGLDCDMCAYEGRVHQFPSQISEFWKCLDQLYYEAEGPIHWRVVRVSESGSITPTSRDLALSAFEDGHPYSVSNPSPLFSL